MNDSYIDKLKKYLEENWHETTGFLDSVENFIEESGLENLIYDIGAGFFSSIKNQNPVSAEKNASSDDMHRNNMELSAWMKEEMEQNYCFQELLREHIIDKGYENKPSDFYNKAQIDRRLFSKMYSEKNPSQPDKKTVFKVVIGFELDIRKSLEMMHSAGYNFTSHKKFDMIIKFCIKEGIYDPEVIDYLLVTFGEKSLYSLE